MKPNQIDPHQIYGNSKHINSVKEMRHGKSWLRESYMTDVIQNTFLRNSMQERILRREQAQQSASNFMKTNKDNLKMYKIKQALKEIQNVERFGQFSKTP
jgi:hypothetical protein